MNTTSQAIADELRMCTYRLSLLRPAQVAAPTEQRAGLISSLEERIAKVAR